MPEAIAKPRRARGLRAVAAAVLALAVSAVLLTTPPPAEAQTAQLQVSNISETAGYTNYLVENGKPVANAFTTGGTSADAYALTSVVVQVTNSGGSQILVSIHNASGINPGTQIGSNLTGTIGPSAGPTTYTANDDILLAGNTTYFLVVNGANRQVDATTSNAQTSTAGWAATIADNGRRRVEFAGGAFGWVSLTGNRSLRFTVNATTGITGTLRSRYDWCFNRPSVGECVSHIKRWEGLSAQRNPITVSLDNDGNTEKRCPSTHQIRKATTSSIKCERTYAPVLPAAGALAEAWGVTEIAPPSQLRDGWDGATRSCEPQSRGYVVLTTTRWHGLNQGCHAHSAIGGAHHEHSRQNH